MLPTSLTASQVIGLLSCGFDPLSFPGQAGKKGAGAVAMFLVAGFWNAFQHRCVTPLYATMYRYKTYSKFACLSSIWFSR